MKRDAFLVSLTMMGFCMRDEGDKMFRCCKHTQNMYVSYLMLADEFRIIVVSNTQRKSSKLAYSARPSFRKPINYEEALRQYIHYKKASNDDT